MVRRSYRRHGVMSHLRLAARLGLDEAVVVTREHVTLNMGRQERQVTAVNTWTLSAHGDHLGGSLERRLEGVGAKGAGPLPLTGSRLQS